MKHSMRIGLAGALLLGAASTIATPRAASAQWSRTYEQFYLPGKFNFTFRREYAAADRLFNAFDYGHAILYERLYNNPGAPVSELETDEYDFITKKLLVSPPKLPLEEAAIEINYAKLAPEAKMMFDWAHLLHRQIYDVLASEQMSQADKDAKIAELVAYYKTRPDLAFSSLPKNMDLMESQPYSLAFRQRYPKFNGLIWGYHWLQVGLYEPLMVGRNQEQRQAGVLAAVSRFKQMLDSAPEHMPRVMPMTAAIAPVFAARYQEASIIFDNLHSMHDVVSDILTNNTVVSRSQKRVAIMEAASRYRDNTSFLMPLDEWKSMGTMMGVENMGGPAVGFLAGFPTPTLARGASMAEAMKGMAGMQHGAAGAGAAGMAGMRHGAADTAGMTGMQHGATGMGDSAKAGAAHRMPAMAGMPAMPGMAHGAMATTSDSMGAMHMSSMMQMHERMMRDPVIRERMMADTAMRRMMQGMMDPATPGMMDPATPGMKHDMPGMTHDMPGMTHDMAPTARPVSARARAATSRKPATVKSSARASTGRKASAVKTPARRSAPAKKSPAKPAPAKPAPMDHSKMPGMNMPGMKP